MDLLSLKAWAEKKRKKECKEGRKSFRQFLSELSLPSVTSFAWICALFFVLVFVVLPILKRLYFSVLAPLISKMGLAWDATKFFADGNGNGYGHTLAVFSGVGAIIFALILFVVEGIKESSNKDKGRVLLIESIIYPLVLFALLGFGYFVINGSHATASVLALVTIAGSMYSLHRLILLNLDKTKFKIQQMALFKNRIGAVTDWAVERRFAENKLMNSLDGKPIKLNFMFSSSTRGENFVKVHHNKSGVVTDLDLRKVYQIGEKIDREAKGVGFVYSDTDVPTVREWGMGELDDLPDELKPPVKNDMRYWHVRIGQSLDKNDPLLSYANNLGVSLQTQDEIEKLANDAVTAKNIQFPNPSDEIRSEIDGLKDQALQAIKNGSAVTLKDILRQYELLAESFVGRLKQCGGNYGYVDAKKERANLFSEWPELSWLRDDISEFLEAISGHAKDDKLFLTVQRFPLELAHISSENENHLLFQEGLALWTYRFAQYLRDGDEEKAEFLLNMFSDYVQYNLIYAYGHGSTIKEVPKAYRDFSLHILYLLSVVIRSIVDNKSVKLLAPFRETTKRLLFGYNTEMAEIEVSDQIYDLESFDSRLAQFCLGIGAWIHKKSTTIPENDEFKEALDQLVPYFKQSLPYDAIELVNLFVEFSCDDVDWFWGLERLDIPADGQVRTVQPHSLLKDYFLALMLDEITKIDLNRISIDTFKNFKQLARYTQKEGYVRKSLSHTNHQNKDALLELFDKIQSLEDERRRLEILDTRTSANKKKKFIEEFLEKFEKNVSVRKFFEINNKVVDVTEPTEAERPGRRGINQIDDKAVFFEDWDTHYANWGESYAQGAVTGEDYYLLNVLREKCQQVELEVGEVESWLSGREWKDTEIIFFSSKLYRIVTKLDNFLYSHKLPKKAGWPKTLLGYLQYGDKNVPTFSFHHALTTPSFMIIDISNLPELLQFDARSDEDIVTFQQHGHFWIGIEAFSENQQLMDGFIETPTEWLTEKGDEEAQRNYLSTRVVVKIFERIGLGESEDVGIEIQVVGPIEEY